MREREAMVVSGIVVLLVLLWLGFLVHRSPEFAGSAVGGAFAVSGASLMLVPLAYSLVKRIAPLRRAATAHVSMRTLLAWHIYAGLVGAILALIHTGHKFQSTLGIALTAVTLVVVLSGFVGRYLLRFVAEDADAKRAEIAALESEFARLASAARPGSPALDVSMLAAPLVQSIADLEYAIRAEDRLRLVFSRWLKWHLAISALLYLLLGLHVWAALNFGLRWFR